LFGRRVRLVCLARRQQTRQHVAVDVHPLRLAVRPVRSADLWPLVPIQSEPAQRVEKCEIAFLAVALGVGVLDAEDEVAVAVSRIHPVEQGGADQANMWNASWRGTEANSYRHDLPLRTTGFVSVPMLSTVILTVSPSSIGPTPSGVPVRIRSPGNSVITAEIHSMIAPTS